MTSNLFSLAINDPLTGSEVGLTNADWYTTDGSTTSPVSEYTYDAYNLLFSTELSGWESNSAQNPYTLGLTVIDVGGDPTIGIGIDMHTNSDSLTRFFNQTRGTDAYNALSGLYSSASNYSATLGNAGVLKFTISADQSEAAFKYYEQQKENLIDSMFGVGSPGNPVPGSTARLALLDLAYNSTLLSPTKSPHLFSDFAKGNQADAWFQIAFDSNNYSGTGAATGASPAGNTARRWEDASLLGLYNNADTSQQGVLNDALSIFAMLSDSTNGHGLTNRTFALNYSYAFASAIQTVSSTDPSQSLYALTNNNINAQLTGEGLQPLQTGDLEANLKQAATTIIQAYVLNSAQNPFADESLYSATSFDPLDVQVATAKGGNNLATSTRNGYQLGTGNSLPSLLIAQGGNDTLDASASTSNDVLIGGTGDDTILGGTGNDYIVAGAGNDWIVLQGGNDTVVLGAGDFSSSDGAIHAGSDTLDATNDSSAFTCYVGAGTHETIDLGSGTPTIYLVSTGTGGGPLQTSLAVTAQWIAPGEWYDSVNDALVVEQPGSSGQLNLNAATKNIEVIYGGSSGSSSQSSQRLSLSQLEIVYAAEASGAGSSSLTTEITLDNFSGSDEDGIDLGSESSGPTVSGSSNLALLNDEGLIGDTTSAGDAHYVYENNAKTGVVDVPP